MGILRQQKAIDRLEDRLARCETLASDLQRENRKLELEFTDLYDKVRHQMSRMAKREALARKENGEDLVVAADVDSPPEIDAVSASILRRRGTRRQAE